MGIKGEGLNACSDSALDFRPEEEEPDSVGPPISEEERGEAVPFWD
jgi:hypothetical protein